MAQPIPAKSDSDGDSAKASHAGSVQLQEIATDSQFSSLTSNLPSSALLVIYFHAPWAEPCKQMSTVLSTLASTYPATSPPSIVFASLNAEELPDISELYDVTAVPYIILQKDGQVLEKISGSDAGKVRAAVEKYAGRSGSSGRLDLPPAQAVSKPAENGGAANELGGHVPRSTDAASTSQVPSGEQSKEELFKRLEGLVKAAPVMLFMKGTPSAPQCGFSRQTVALLRERSIRYGFFNILADDDVRQGLKEYSDWPTFPQLYVEGELVGGLDIVREEFQNNPEFLMEYSVQKTQTGS
ncbi:Grx4 family monothiol glutaredoxin [Verruconis gallopava]|uniref:Grx4 family monothiol glutaredoxin n=1 Tax=Verruconis gallopava TaxID=253628 RepID=A0A0D2ALT4_9PEZI|nr:Grx4 family monothiol glutaredoxin [Verruconis gallopava]KIW07728.1 Grx4 family monothiol glutaredoxin [Verruconis gallopava]